MRKYRIVEVKIPELQSSDGTADFMPQIEYRCEYHVERLDFDFFPLKKWTKIWQSYYLERAELQVKFLQEKETYKVIKEY